MGEQHKMVPDIDLFALGNVNMNIHGTEIEIVADGGVFGDGSHETTRLMLDAIHQTDLRGASVLDIGTGTGVLAIYAKKQGADKVTAVDIDYLAIMTARKNFERNNVEIVSRLNILNEYIEPHDVTLVNIAPHIVGELITTLDGVLICSFPHGLFEHDCRRPLEKWAIELELVGKEWDVYRLRRKP